MHYDNKTVEELIDLLEAKDEEISELQETEQNIEELNDEIYEYQNQEEEYNHALADREGVSEKAFYAGYESGKSAGLKSNESNIKAWLNYKMEARL